MSYSKKYRERTIEYRPAGHSLEETHQIFKVSKSTIQKWEKQLKETGDSEKAAQKLPKDRSGKAEGICCGIVAAQMGGRILAPFQYSGTMDSSLFEFWFSNQLLPSLEQGTVIVMDNASFHSKKRLLFAAQNAGCRLLFLPPYSPELNPIEKFWAWLKRFLSKILPSAPSFDDALSTAFQLW